MVVLNEEYMEKTFEHALKALKRKGVKVEKEVVDDVRTMEKLDAHLFLFKVPLKRPSNCALCDEPISSKLYSKYALTSETCNSHKFHVGCAIVAQNLLSNEHGCLGKVCNKKKPCTKTTKVVE